MNRPFRKQVKIVKSSQMADSDQQGGYRTHRDTRPGRFTIKGSFIKLPGSPDATADERRG